MDLTPFLTAIDSSPEDMLMVGILADYLAEHGDPREHILRWAIEHGKRPLPPVPGLEGVTHYLAWFNWFEEYGFKDHRYTRAGYITIPHYCQLPHSLYCSHPSIHSPARKCSDLWLALMSGKTEKEKK